METYIEIIYNPLKEEWGKILRSNKVGETWQNDAGVSLIIENIGKGGDQALLSYVRIFDKVNLKASELLVSEEEYSQACASVPKDLAAAIECAIKNVTKFHAAQKPQDIEIETMPGVICRQKNIPVSSVGLYIPGGTAPLFSTVIMLTVPAKLAGCKEIVLCSPVGKNGKIAPEVLYCAKMCGVDISKMDEKLISQYHERGQYNA